MTHDESTFNSVAGKARSLTAGHCSWAVGRKRPPLCGGSAPATPPPKTCLIDLVPIFVTGAQSKEFRQTASRQSPNQSHADKTAALSPHSSPLTPRPRVCPASLLEPVCFFGRPWLEFPASLSHPKSGMNPLSWCIPCCCLPAARPFIAGRNTPPTDNNRSPAILKIPINSENPDSDNDPPPKSGMQPGNTFH